MARWWCLRSDGRTTPDRVPMKTQKGLRLLHYWLSIALALPAIVMIAAGILLMLKKEIGWIQPPTQSGKGVGLPALSHAEMLDRVTSVPAMRGLRWEDFDRIDYKPGKGLAKFISADRWEVQLDTQNGEILQVARRRSDFIEAIHDGSYFADWVKLFVFLPAGCILLIMWGTGLYMFFLPRVKRARRRRAKQSRRIDAATQAAE